MRGRIGANEIPQTANRVDGGVRFYMLVSTNVLRGRVRERKIPLGMIVRKIGVRNY